MIISWINCVWVLAFLLSQRCIVSDVNSERIQAQNCSVHFLDNFSFTAKQEQLQNSKIRDDWMIFTPFIFWFMQECWHVKTMHCHLLTVNSSQLFCQKTSTDIRHCKKMRIHHSERFDKSSHSACLPEIWKYYIHVNYNLLNFFKFFKFFLFNLFILLSIKSAFV